MYTFAFAENTVFHYNIWYMVYLVPATGNNTCSQRSQEVTVCSQSPSQLCNWI